MTLEQMSYLSQTIAAVAVVVSLIYLALQTRQSARSQRAMMHAKRQEDAAAMYQWVADPSNAPVYFAGAEATPGMDVIDAHRFYYISRLQFMNLQELFLGWRDGLLDDDRWQTTVVGLRRLLRYPGYRAAYKLYRKDAATPGFRALADGLLEEVRGKPAPRDAAQAWLAMAAEERALMTSSEQA